MNESSAAKGMSVMTTEFRKTSKMRTGAELREAEGLNTTRTRSIG